MNKIENIKTIEQAEKIAKLIGGVLIMLNGTTALISGGDITKLHKGDK